MPAANDDLDPNDPNAATQLLWRQLVQPVPIVDVAQALFGLPAAISRQLSGALLATSPEANALLAAMPKVLRGLSITTVQSAVRCQGEVRGPVLWSETMAARAGTAGATDVYVCLTAERAYDTPQNRVLVAALLAIRKAADAADPVARQAYNDEVLLRARINGTEARHYLEHRTMKGVNRKRVDGRTIAKTRSGSRNDNYEPALAVLERSKSPVGLNHLLSFSDPRTAWQHWVIMALAARLRARGHPLPVYRPTPNGDLRAGRLTYRHPTTAKAVKNPLHGILFERLLIDVPDPIDHPDLEQAAADLGARAQGRVPVLVTGEDDIDRAVDLAFSGLG
jgi:hypothetical protein